ncbi:MAG: ferritin-like domain-containing protein [Thermoprotei archaeon]|nr:MAG: ferritin-like domain-containing protein [Thermoprotei archaeon]
MEEEKNLVEVFKEFSTREEEYARKLVESAKSFRHPVLQALLKAISRDSEKHSEMYRALVDLLARPQPVLTGEEYRLIAESIDAHIKVEKEMISLVREALGKTEDPRLRVILSAIYDDELKHHSLLVSLKKNIAEREVMSEEELWDAVWKESPWHGAPGG